MPKLEYDEAADLYRMVETAEELEHNLERSADLTTLASAISKLMKQNDPDKAAVEEIASRNNKAKKDREAEKLLRSSNPKGVGAK